MIAWAMLLTLWAADTQRAWPSHSRGAERPAPTVVAIVNGVTLKSDRLDAAVGALLPMESFHQNVNAEIMAELRKKALVQIVDDELQYQDAVKRGLAVKDPEVDAALAKAVARYPSRKAFNDALAQSGASLADMRRELRRRLLITKAHEQRVMARCVVDREEAQRYFKEHPDRFIEPERLHIRAITLGVDPSSGESGWKAARERAEDVRKQLTGGAAFEDLARKYSTDPSGQKGGDMGVLHRGSLSEGFETVATGLPIGQPSPVVETIYGYHIFEVTEVLPPQPRSFADVGARLQQDLSTERCAATGNEWTAALRAAATIAYP
ncbi:MAG: peptidylprolyl isomerase [Vicinamibacterales bacterium]